MIKYIYKILTTKERKKGIVILFFVFFTAIFELFGLLSVLPFMAVVGKPSLIKTNYYLYEVSNYLEYFGIKTDIEFLTFLGILSLIVLLFSGVFRLASQLFINRFIEYKRHSIEMRILNVYLKKEYQFFVLNHSQDLSKTVLSDVDQFITQALRPTINMIAYGFVLVSLIFALIIFNPKLALLSILFLGSISFFLSQIMRRLTSKIGNVRSVENKKRYVYSGEIFSSIKEIKFSNTQLYYLNRFSKSSLKFSESQSKYMFILQVPNIVIETMLFIGMLIATLIFFHSQNKLSDFFLGEILPTIGFFGLSVLRLKPAAIAVYNGAISLRYAKSIVSSIHNIITQEDEINISRNEKVTFSSSIKIESVSFKYSESDNLILKNIDLSIEKGKSIGIIGPSGAGKSTLLDLLMCLIIPSSGSILVDNKQLNVHNIKSWQAMIGYVPQSVHLIDDTIIKNIAFGLPQEYIDIDRVHKCCEIVQLDRYISDILPKGYFSLVGERGVQLSGGQKQRIGIARALYHDPQIIIFDEASSALDVDTELAVMSAINELSRTKTLIIVAHRLSTVKSCDFIYQIEDGIIKSKGTPNEILKL